MGIEKKAKLRALVAQVERYKEEGNLLHAFQICNSLIEEFEDELDSYVFYSEVCEAMGNINPAIEILKNYTANYPDDKYGIMYFGEFLLRNSKWDEAINALSFILPEDIPEVSFLIGYAHFMLQEYQHAALHLKRYMKIIKSKLEPESVFLLLKSQIQLNEYSDALKLLKKYEKTFYYDDTFNMLYGIVCYELEMIEHAVTHIEKALAVQPSDPAINFWAGKIYFKLQNHKKAESSLLFFVNHSENIAPEACYLLAEVYLQQNNINEALKYYELAVKLEPKKRRFIEPLEKLIYQEKNINSNE
ncbi:MAG TPA: tetratricopeptide repeat protein [Ignavibacteriaceae bacterium]|nr:tetratricopeptide repeat protein [Ignavibacteriaceae bacterium]